MSRCLSLVLCLSVALVTTACAAHHMAEDQWPAAEGKAVRDYVIKTSPYQDWALWPGKDKLYKGQMPHGSFLTTYVSAGARKAIEEKAGRIPFGEMVVKENYTSEKQLAAITVMYKKQEYNPDGGNWFWLKFTPDGTIQKEGKVGGCLGCHGAVKANDWLFTGPIK